MRVTRRGSRLHVRYAARCSGLHQDSDSPVVVAIGNERSRRDQRVQPFGALGLQMPMLLQVPFVPFVSTGHVVLSPGVQAAVQT